ncbi:MAG: hypothetical protein M1575_03480 [Patescibacteria group bacterium]|nr:hypothetical protein [Patescibacteria group bacterium]MCL5095760.1 hypothetical protein [Patescibacteria group bacterium]
MSPDNRRIYESEARAFADIVPTLLEGKLPPEDQFNISLKRLLKDRQGNQHTETQIQALNLLHHWVDTLAHFGVPSLNLEAFTAEIHLPPVESEHLIKLGIIVNKEIMTQIMTRRRRKGLPPENRVVVRALQETTVGGLKPKTTVYSLQELYTVTMPIFNSGVEELDVIREYLLGQDQDDKPTLLFMNERQVPHIHFHHGNTTYRLDAETNPSYLPHEEARKNYPEAKTVPAPTPATNEELATLMALVYHSVKQVFERKEN